MFTASQRKLFFTLSFFMGLIVISSNYLVQFPVKFYELENLLTYGAFSYPITFLITDLANRAFGKKIARYVVLIGFFIGIISLETKNFSKQCMLRLFSCVKNIL